MIQDYFYDQHGMQQKDKIKREKAVAAVLEIIKESAGHVPMHITLDAITDKVDQAADALQAALEK